MSEDRYVVAWRNRLTGQSGQAKTLLDEAQALMLCSEAAKRHPDVEYSPALIMFQEDCSQFETPRV